MNSMLRTIAAALLTLSTLAVAAAQSLEGPFELQGPVFDIEALPGGGLAATQGPAIVTLSADGVATMAEVPTVEGSVVNGLASIDGGGMFAASSALDLALGAGVWLVEDGDARLVGDIEAYETAHDPDALAGNRWKHALCEDDAAQGFTAGPQSNPYHLIALSSTEAAVADAAGNTLLAVDVDGSVELIAVFEPPIDEDGAWHFLKTAENDPDIDCYVQPVPTAVAQGPDGALYVGELTGAPAVPGWSRVWRIAPGARDVVCPSEDCAVAISGLTSVIDLAFGPDGGLYVVELDRGGWLSVIVGGAMGGAVKRCDVASGACEVVDESDVTLGAIAFDAAGTPWVVENERIFAAGPSTVRRLELP